MNEAMVRFNLVNGNSYALLGDEAMEAYRQWKISTDGLFQVQRGDIAVVIYERHIVSIEWRGMENEQRSRSAVIRSEL